MSETPVLVELRGVWKIYDVGPQRVPALRDVSMQIRHGEYLAIMGHSGSGKSTMLNLLGCLDRPTRGEYWLGSQEVSTLTDGELSEVRSRKIGFVFQSFNLIQGVSVVENIEVPLFYQGISRGRRRPRSMELGRMVGLGDRLWHRPQQLSGGQQQRVAIARALANEPLVLLADEPTGNLDSATTREILGIFDRLHESGATIIMVTHEDDVAAHCQRVIWLGDGSVISDERNGERMRVQ